jgi:hypothetical protein
MYLAHPYSVVQLWDTLEGVIAWERVEILSLAREPVAEDYVAQRAFLGEASKSLIKGIP